MAENRKKRVKIIPDKVFRKLWDLSLKTEDEHEYINRITNSSSKLNYKKYDIDYVEFVEMLKNIYTCSHMEIKEIFEKIPLKKSKASDIFCIPIRTIEDWYAGKNKCPSYIKLMILRHYHMINLGKYIKLQSYVDFFDTLPNVYNKKKDNSENYNLIEEDNTDTNQDAQNEYYDVDFLKYLDRIINKDKKKEHVYDKINNDTKYIDEILNRRKGN